MPTGSAEGETNEQVDTQQTQPINEDYLIASDTLSKSSKQNSVVSNVELPQFLENNDEMLNKMD